MENDVQIKEMAERTSRSKKSYLVWALERTICYISGELGKVGEE
jgi:hypothetical protein